MNYIKILFFTFLFVTFTKVNAQTIDQRATISIYFEVDATTFPSSWHSKKIAAKGVSLDSSEIERSIVAVKKALRKYPISTLQKNISKIYVLKSIEFYGQTFGGTNSTDVIYIANNGVAKGYTSNYLEKTFHHEFSSILLRKFPHFLDKNEWQNQNNIQYGKGGVQALKDNNDSQNFDEKLHEKGFLYEYAVSGFENDFNSFAENLFLPSKDFYKTVDKHNSVKNKFEMIVQFYESIDPSMRENYFRDVLGREE